MQSGRVAYVSDGPYQGKLITIVDIIDQNRVKTVYFFVKTFNFFCFKKIVELYGIERFLIADTLIDMFTVTTLQF